MNTCNVSLSRSCCGSIEHSKATHTAQPVVPHRVLTKSENV